MKKVLEVIDGTDAEIPAQGKQLMQASERESATVRRYKFNCLNR